MGDVLRCRGAGLWGLSAGVGWDARAALLPGEGLVVGRLAGACWLA